MSERRNVLRSRTYLGGEISFNARRSTLACTIRNLSAQGACIEFDGTALLPEAFQLTVARKDVIFRVHTIWCTQASAGVQFVDAGPDGTISLDMTRKLKARETENAELRRRIAELSESAI